MENQIELTKTAIELARLDNRGNITKAETSRNRRTQSSVRKQPSSFAAVQERKPRSRSSSVNNKNIEHLK